MKIEPIQVHADFEPQGKVYLRAFVYQGRNIPVDSIGRQWQAGDGRHVLVMDSNLRHYHLVFQPDPEEWFLLEIGQVPPVNRA